MLKCVGLHALPALNGPVATLGTFDGVHLGHQRVIAETRHWAHELGGETVVVTFARHPRRVIQGQAPALITSVAHRLVLFERLGVDVAVVLPFDKSLAQLSAEDFVRRVFVDGLNIKGVVLGFDCVFGQGRRGNIELLQHMGTAHGFDARQCASVELDDTTISSTVVRDKIEGGDLAAASRMLGRPVSLLGTVVHGAGLGKELGFPTANLDLHHEAKPPDGVYLTRALVNDREWPSLTNIGTRPTVCRMRGGESVAEVYIEGLHESLYGQDVEVQFVRKLREEARFATVDELKVQMAADRDVMRSELGGSD